MARSVQAQFILALTNMRWHEMGQAGWEITELSHSQNAVSVEIKKGDYSATFSVPRSLNVVDIQNRLLSLCEQFAALADYTGEE